ncbi:MAG: hypothetical protein JJT76_06305 [Clostridiaceae bacterium]|nr:hypothetical protein [Clostridiaceae bacterium]
MPQGIIGGATSYEEQSMKDILSDIESWIEYTKSNKRFIEEGIGHLKECNFWDEIPFNFQMTILSTITCQKTYLEDFEIISNAIKDDRVSEKEVKLLAKIGKKAREFNNEYGRTYKDESRWKKYGDKDFKVAENLYARGRDYFVSLQDASNAACRLEDYITTVPAVTNNNINQTVSGTGNVVAGINSGEMRIINNSNNFAEECKEASLAINKVEDIEEDIKKYIIDLLNETKEAIEKSDEEKEKICKRNYIGFVKGAGVKAFKVIGVLSSFASIASFFGITG